MRTRIILTAFFTLLAILFYDGGCVVGIFGTPTQSEQKIPAEYDLAKCKNQKILVLVNQPLWLNIKDNLPYYLTKEINEELKDKIEIKPSNLFEYSKVSDFRANHPDFTQLSAAAIGRMMNADMVLRVAVENYQIKEMGEMAGCSGSLSTQCFLIDVKTGKKFWPLSAASKSVNIDFDIETKGAEAANSRLVKSTAYCIVRYLYDCPKDKFKISEDRNDTDWGNWNK